MSVNSPIDLLSVAARRREEAATAVHYALMMQRSPAAAETLAQAAERAHPSLVMPVEPEE